MNTQINFSNQTNKTALAGQASVNVPVVSNQTPITRMVTVPVLKNTIDALKKLNGFVGCGQAMTIMQACAGEEKQWFCDKLAELAEIVTTMPTTYETDGQGDQAVVYLHYFTPSADWYITERDREAEQLQAFGKADLGYGGELGYISIVELLECGAELNLHWQIKKFSEI